MKQASRQPTPPPDSARTSKKKSMQRAHADSERLAAEAAARVAAGVAARMAGMGVSTGAGSAEGVNPTGADIQLALPARHAAMTIKGTLVYQAPEVSRGERYGFAADVYSFALTMYEVCDRVRFQ